MQSECDHSSYPFTVVLPGLWGPGWCFILTLGFGEFYNDALSIDSCLLVFLGGGLKSEITYMTILMM